MRQQPARILMPIILIAVLFESAPICARAAGAAAAATGGYTIDWTTARKFWSFQPVSDPKPPVAAPGARAANPIDAFVEAGLRAHHLTPAKPADRRTLLRRATYDLTGLPPTPEELSAFLGDKSPNAFAKVVDRLLASPQYGAQWGRHWLDLVRYADTSGCNSDFPVPSAYLYRNYVVDSLNADKPYNRFIEEQLAGDLLPATTEPARRQQTIATGYLAIARRFGSQANEFHLTMEDAIDNLGKTFLGLSVSCARCHDHKFDPILQKDYYGLYGILNSARYAFPGTEVLRHPKDFIPLGGPEAAATQQKYDDEMSTLDRKIKNLRDERLRAEAAAAHKGGSAAAPTAGRTVAEIDRDIAAGVARQAELDQNPPKVEKAYAVTEGTIANAKIQIKGDPGHPGDEAPRAFLQVLGGQTLPPDEKGSGRLELARWITDPKNPLTARVMVNRIWQFHFGKGIVQTPSDFGSRGKRPTHPELLDYLASRFAASGWSLKSMHRLMMLSRTYQQSSESDSKNAALDTENDQLWRFDRRRLSAEEIRDSLMAVGGTLDLTQGGPHPFPPETDWHYTQHVQFVDVYPTNRRSIYLIQQRIKKHPFLEVFDGADANSTSPDRPISTTPIQALFMMNDPFANAQATGLATRVSRAAASESGRIEAAYQLALGRSPQPDEAALAHRYLAQVKSDYERLPVTTVASAPAPGAPAPDAAAHALASYCRMLLSSNEFMFLD